MHREDDEYQNESISCDSCETSSDNSGSLQGHRRTHAYNKETDEAYDVSTQQFRPYIARKWIRGISEFEHKAFLLSKKFLKIPPYAKRL